MTVPTSAAAPGRDIAAESARSARLVELRAKDARLATAARMVGGLMLLLALTCACLLIALPDTVSFGCRSAQVVATLELRRLLVTEESFRSEKDRYGTNAAELEFETNGARAGQYAYLVRAEDHGGKPGFVIFAVGTGGMAGDLWTLDEGGEPRNLRDLCRY